MDQLELQGGLIIVFFNQRKKLNKLKEKGMIERIGQIIKHANAVIIEFYKDYKAFGNIVLRIQEKDLIHEFVTDRGDIYYNGKPLFFTKDYYMLGFSDLTAVYLIIAVEKVFEKRKCE